MLRLADLVPLVVVQIVGGVALGPGVLGAAAPSAHHAMFTPETVRSLSAIGSWAVMLFVWLAGVELDISAAWTRRGETLLTSALALGAPLALGTLAAGALLLAPGWRGSHGSTWQAALGIGMACAVTALPILVLFLEQLALLDRPIGQRVLRYASLDDVAIWAVLALIICDWTRLGRQGLFIAGFALTCPLVRALVARLEPRDRWPLGLIWLLSCALAADAAGLHFMVGAFLAGAVLDKALLGADEVEMARRMVLQFLMPVFFLITGLRTRWAVGDLAVFGAAALLLAASLGGKLGGVALAGRLLRWERGEATLIGWLLQTKALIMIIFASVLLDKDIITAETFTALLLMAVASTVLTIPAVRLSNKQLACLSLRRVMSHQADPKSF